MTISTPAFLDRLHQGGNYAYFWTSNGRRSVWYEVNNWDPYRAAIKEWGKGAQNIYFPVFPLSQIPSFNSKGEATDSKYVRGQIEYVQLANCLFAEFDAKQFGSLGKCAQHIRGITLKPSIIVFSGGGYHCYWLLTEPMTDIALLRELQARWVLFTGGDEDAKDAARVLRLPGSTNYKPQYGPDFPLVEIKQEVSSLGRIYNVERLYDAAPPLPRVEYPPLPPMQSYGNRRSYVQKAIRSEYDRVAHAPEGGRNAALNKAAYYLAQLIRPSWAQVTEDEVIQILTGAAYEAGLHDDPNCGPNQIHKSILSGIKAGIGHPREEPPPRNNDERSRSAGAAGRSLLQEAINDGRHEYA